MVVSAKSHLALVSSEKGFSADLQMPYGDHLDFDSIDYTRSLTQRLLSQAAILRDNVKIIEGRYGLDIFFKYVIDYHNFNLALKAHNDATEELSFSINFKDKDRRSLSYYSKLRNAYRKAAKSEELSSQLIVLPDKPNAHKQKRYDEIQNRLIPRSLLVVNPDRRSRSLKFQTGHIPTYLKIWASLPQKARALTYE